MSVVRFGTSPRRVSTITSPAFSEVVIVYRDYDFVLCNPQITRSGLLCAVRTERVKEALSAPLSLDTAWESTRREYWKGLRR